MSSAATEVIGKRIQMAHAWILQATERLSEDELCHRFGPLAPPIGWHLWHITRWADRVQASLPRQDADPNHQPNPNHGIWEQEQIAQRWKLDSTTLGTLEEGSGMNFEDAAALPQRVGKDALLGYAQQIFALTDGAVASLLPAQFEESRLSVMEYKYNVADGTIWKVPGAPTTLAADLAFHLSHVNRHLGMIEALSGLLERKGTVTV